ncbi:hypothetical protein [Paraburkholderia metrosideri]|jgi:hypothetical protein|uniref:hypothetical protein n=1 Tax=Paraburkholderia metrosideri TaxID=580937 RepID=UPI001917F93F|nr:hypothetical protein [Paraburkholderia metrosideri]
MMFEVDALSPQEKIATDNARRHDDVMQFDAAGNTGWFCMRAQAHVERMQNQSLKTKNPAKHEGSTGCFVFA